MKSGELDYLSVLQTFVICGFEYIALADYAGILSLLRSFPVREINEILHSKSHTRRAVSGLVNLIR